MTPIDSTATPRVESAEWITGLASVSSDCSKCVLIVEDTSSREWNRVCKRLLCAAATSGAELWVAMWRTKKIWRGKHENFRTTRAKIEIENSRSRTQKRMERKASRLIKHSCARFA